jgi:hypothetical protein
LNRDNDVSTSETWNIWNVKRDVSNGSHFERDVGGGGHIERDHLHCDVTLFPSGTPAKRTIRRWHVKKPQILHFLKSPVQRKRFTWADGHTATPKLITVDFHDFCERAYKYVPFSSRPLRTKLYLFDLKTQSVPRSKHSLPRLYKPVS